MHYKNGRDARNGDTVIGKLQYGLPIVMVGMIADINPGSTSCNATLIRPGGLIQTCITVGDFYHAEDAFGSIESMHNSIPDTANTATAPSTCECAVEPATPPPGGWPQGTAQP